MAKNKRMFDMKVVDSDAFLNLPKSAQALYFHLSMRADDDGFIGNGNRLIGYLGCSRKDIKLLIENRFVLEIESVLVIKHWKINNCIPKDRYNPTSYRDELSKMIIKDNGSYTEYIQNDNKIDTLCYHKDHTEVYGQSVQSGYTEEVEEVEELEGVDIVHSDEPHETDTLEEFYESIWKLYPVKKGKGQVSKAKKQVLQRLGYEQIQRCVERFVADMESESRDKKYWMHGSTFFNSGYIDYLDCNYSVADNDDSNNKTSDNNSDSDRFSVLEKDFREELEFLGIIDSQSLDLGNASDEQIERLQKAGVL